MARTDSITLLISGVAVIATATAVLLPACAFSLGSERPLNMVQEALVELEAGHYDAAELLALAVADEPGEEENWRAWIIAAAARRYKGRSAHAAEAYRRFASNCTDTRMRVYALNSMRRCEQAQRSVPAAPSANLSEEDLAALGDVDEEYHVETSAHFVVRTRNAALAKLLVFHAERALERVRSLVLGRREYPHVVDIVVWPDEESFAANAQHAPEWSGGSFVFSMNDGLVTRRIDLTQLNEGGEFATVMLDSVLPHELSHLVLSEFFGDASCPLMINEGLAMLAEWRRDENRMILAAVSLAGQADRELSALLLVNREQLDAPTRFYAQSYSFMSFLHDRLSDRQFHDFLRHLQGGCTVADALQRALYTPMDEEFVTRLAVAWEDYTLAHAQYLRALSRSE
jgi:hypothetical protein